MKLKCMLFGQSADQIKAMLEKSGTVEVENIGYPEVIQDEDVPDDHKTYGKNPQNMLVILPDEEEGVGLLLPGWYERLYDKLPDSEKRQDCYVLPRNMIGFTDVLSFEDLIHVGHDKQEEVVTFK